MSSIVETLSIWKKNLKNWHNGVIIDAYKLIICAVLIQGHYWSGCCQNVC